MKLDVYGSVEYSGVCEAQNLQVFDEEAILLSFKGKDISGALSLTISELEKFGFYKKVEPKLDPFRELYYQFCKYNEGESQAHTNWFKNIYESIGRREVCLIDFDNKVKRRKLNVGTYSFLKQQLRTQLKSCEKFDFFIGCNHVKLSSKTDEEWKENLEKPYMIEGLLDFDSENIEDARNECLLALECIEKQGYSDKVKINFTGSKGFHIIIPHEIMVKHYGLKDKDTYQDHYTIEEAGETRRRLTQYFKEQGIKIDDAVTGGQQVRRCEYTIHPKTNLVCTPITIEELKKPVKKQEYTIEKTLQKIGGHYSI